MKHKRLLALLLAVCMVLALLPAIAAAETTEVTDVLNRALTEVTGTDYKEWSGKTSNSNAVYAGQSAGGNESIQLRSNNSNSGIVTTVSGGKVTKVAVEWHSNTAAGRTLNIYGKNSAYTQATDLYDTSNQGTLLGTIVKGTSTELTISGDYAYIGMRSNSGAMYFSSIEITWSVDGDTPQPETYTVSFDANGGEGTMADVTDATSPYTLPECAFTAPEGKEFDCWTVEGEEGTYAPGSTYTLTADTTFVAQWKDLPVVTYTDMMLKRVPSNGDVVVIYYPAAGKVMTGTDHVFNSKHELATVDATLTDDVLAVPSNALCLTVSAADGKYTFATADGKYLEADGTHVQLVSEQGANTLFQLETAAAGTDNYYIKCDSATYGDKAQYIDYNSGYITVWSMGTNPTYYTFQFFSEDGEGPTPETTYTVSFDANGGTGTMEDVTDATNPYMLPECAFTAPEGCIFAGWQMAGGETVYAAGEQVTLEEPNTTFVATWKEHVAKNYTLVTYENDLVDGGTYLIASELFVDELYVMSNQTTNFRNDYKVSGVEGNTVTLDESWIASDANDNLAFEFKLVQSENGWSFYDALNNGYLAAVSSGSNYMGTKETLDGNGIFSISFADESGATVPVAQGTYTRNYLHYNAQYNRFSCYASTSSLSAPVYLYKLVEEEQKPSFVSQSLLLDGLIGVSFNMELPEISGVDYSTSYMTFSIEHGTCTERADYSNARAKRSAENKGFVCYVNAVQMAEPITATFHYTQNGTELTVEKTYAIKEYFDAYDENKSQFDETTQALIESLANYGHYVQAMLAAQKGWTLGDGADADYRLMDKSYETSHTVSSVTAAVADKGLTVENDGAALKKLNFTAVFDSATTLRLLVKLTSGYTGEFTATVDGDPNTPAFVGGWYHVDIENVAAHQLSKAYTVVVTTDVGSATITESALSYVKLMIGSTDSTVQNAMVAIYGYSAAADALKAAH